MGTPVREMAQATRRDGKQIYCSLALPEVIQACQLIRDVLNAQVRTNASLSSDCVPPPRIIAACTPRWYCGLSRTRSETHLRQQMASFYIHDGAQALTLQISGTLTQGAAAELEQTWLTARSTLAGRELLVDLCNVISADDGGQTVLRRLASHGARFITSSRLTEALAEEASRRMPELLPVPRASVWNRLACCLKTFCGTAKASLKRALPCGPIVRKLW